MDRCSDMKIGKKKIDVTNLVIHIIFICLTLLMIYPFISMISVSLTPEQDMNYNGYRIWPEHPDLGARCHGIGNLFVRLYYRYFDVRVCELHICLYR